MPERTSKKQTKDREKSEQEEQRKGIGEGADVVSNHIITGCRVNCTKETEYIFTLWLQI